MKQADVKRARWIGALAVAAAGLAGGVLHAQERDADPSGRRDVPKPAATKDAPKPSPAQPQPPAEQGQQAQQAQQAQAGERAAGPGALRDVPRPAAAREAEASAGARAGAPPAPPPPGAGRAPLDALGLLLDGLHVRDGRPDEQMEVFHFCGPVTPSLQQCALFDRADGKGRLVGIEYVITAEAVSLLPESERALWHSHAYEVKSGMLAALGMDPRAEHELMGKLAGTYGKTWHTWHVHRGDSLPTGRPALMMSFTADGQARPELVQHRDDRLGLSTEDLRKHRADILAPELVPGVDRGESGESCAGPLEPRRR